MHQLGVKVESTQLPAVPREKSGWPWTTPKPPPREYLREGVPVGEEEVAAARADSARATGVIERLGRKEDRNREENKRLKQALKTKRESAEVLAVIEPQGDAALLQSRVIVALKSDDTLSVGQGGGSAAMLLCQRQLHQSKH